MSDNKQKRGKPDRNKVAGKEGYEVSYLATQLNVSHQQITGAIKVVGNNRKDVIAYVKNKTKNSK